MRKRTLYTYSNTFNEKYLNKDNLKSILNTYEYSVKKKKPNPKLQPVRLGNMVDTRHSPMSSLKMKQIWLEKDLIFVLISGFIIDFGACLLLFNYSRPHIRDFMKTKIIGPGEKSKLYTVYRDPTCVMMLFLMEVQFSSETVQLNHETEKIFCTFKYELKW